MKLKTGEILNKDQDKKVVSTVKLSKGTRAGTIKLVVNGEEQDNVAVKNFKGGYGSGIGSGDITELWEAINKKLDVDFFHNIFTVFTNENSEIQPNTYEGTADNLKISIGTWSEKFLSALGKNPDEGQGTGMGTVIGIALGDADPIFPDENSGIVTLPAYPSKVSQLENDSNFVTQSVMTNYVTATLSTALSNYYTKAEADAKFMTIAAFERIFNIYDGSDPPQKLNHPYSTITPTSSIKALVGLWTEQYLSALGLNPSGGSGGGSVNWIRIGEQDYSPDQAGVTDITDAFTSYSYISNGVVHIGDNTYTYSLPTASSSVLGGIKIGSTLTITNSGVLNLTPVGTAGTYVGVTVDSYGRVTSGTSASNYYTKAQIDDAFLSKAFFQKLFQAYNLNSTNNVNSPVNPVNPTTDAGAVVNNLESIFGFWTREYISALGRNSNSGGGGIGTVTAIKTGNNSYLEPDVETGIIDMSSYFTKWNNIANNGVTNVGYSGKKLSKTINGNTTDIVSASTLFTDGLPTNVTKSYVLAAPANNAGTPQFRQLTLADIPNTTDLQTIASLPGTTGFLKKTGSGQWALDTDVAAGTRKIIAGNGLTGGGDLTADRTLSVLLQENSGLIVSSSGLKLDIINNLTTESAYKAISATQAKYIWDYLTSMFEREGAGTAANPYRIKAKYGFYSVSYVSALGSNSDSGSGGLDEDAMWAALTTNTGTYKNTKINVGHIPDMASTYNYVKTSDLSAYATQDWVTNNFNKYTLPLASSSTRGGVKIGFTTSGKNYAVQLSNEKMYVNVPWTDTTYTIAGLMGATSVGNATTPVYWNGSTWKTCTSYSSASVNYAASAGTAGTATSATKASKVIDSYNTSKEITITYAKDGQSSTSWLASWNGYELGSISPSNITAGAAVKDGAGNTITSKYVTLDTPQPISGAKTFSATVRLSGCGIEDISGAGLLIYKPSSDWTGISSSQWGVGAISCTGIIRSSNAHLVHYRDGVGNYNILDTYNAPYWTMWIYPESSSTGSFATHIGSNTDLNSILEAGTYYCYSGATAATLSNTPYTDGNFRLWNIVNTGTNGSANNSWFAQLLLAPNSGDFYIRGHTSNGFYSWARLFKSTGGSITGHLYLDGAQASSSTGNTSQIIFRVGSTQQVAISSNTNALIINPTSSTTTGQWVIGVNGHDTYSTGSGNFGIGISPTQKLHVSGNILATGGITALSDIRHKSPISDVNTSIADISKLPLFYFKWKYKDDDNMHIGTSAQAVQKLFPELVLGGEELSVNYGVLGTTLGILNARKMVNHEERIKSLEEENKALRREINKLKGVA